MDDIKKKRIIGIVIIIVGAVLLVAIVYFLFFYNFPTPPSPAEPAAETSPEEAIPAALPATPQAVVNIRQQTPLSSGEITEEELKRLAASFAERFGSFSNQSPYANILDLKIFMTQKMQNWADKYIEDLKAEKADTSIYYGITTKAVATETKKYDEGGGQAEFLVQTQRRKAIASTKNAATSQEDILIMFVKKGGAWKVDGAYWQNK